jgi:DNA-binding transcriptional regulator YiaG
MGNTNKTPVSKAKIDSRVDVKEIAERYDVTIKELARLLNINSSVFYNKQHARNAELCELESYRLDELREFSFT